MSQFRFPIAILSYWKDAKGNPFDQSVVLERARDWAIPQGKKKPTLLAAETWIAELVADDDRKRNEEKERRSENTVE